MNINLILLVVIVCGAIFYGVLSSEKKVCKNCGRCKKCGGVPYFGNPGTKPPAHPVRWHVGR